MANVLKVNAAGTGAGNLAEKDLGSNHAEVYITFDVYIPAAVLASATSLLGDFAMGGLASTLLSSRDIGIQMDLDPPWRWYTYTGDASPHFQAVTTSATSADTWATVSVHYKEAVDYPAVQIAGVDYGTVNPGQTPSTDIRYVSFGNFGGDGTGYFYMRNLKVGTSAYGSSELFSEDFSGGDLSNFTSTSLDVSVIADPTTPGGGGGTVGRVLIAFDDTPLEPNPTWTRIDDTDNLVSGIDIETGKQTELDRTDTGTATVYLNDTSGDWDPLNASSPYFGKLDGKQILIQLRDPVTATWEPQWRGWINDYGYTINPATNPDGTPVVSTVQVDCVDVFDYLAGYQLRVGEDGDVPPAGSEGVIFYEDTAGTVDDRIIQILTDASIDSTRWVVFSGNVSVQETKYDPGDAALTALRDAADAEFPGLANIYVDRFGRFVFHGRYARFTPDTVAAGAGSAAWDFQRWKVGDGVAISGDSDYAQMRVLAYTHGRSDIINYAIAWPKGIAESSMPSQKYEDATSQSDYGMHALPPMSDLIINEGTTTMNTGAVECQKFAEFFVHYLKDPQTRITELMVKAIQPADARATSTWAVLTRADISDIIHVKAQYPGGTGLDGDNYIEGISKRIRPLNPSYDYVEAEYRLTPTEWAMDPDGILAAAS